MTERVDRAAVRQGGKVHSLPRPARHRHILAKLASPAGERGFVTSAGRFLDRRAALRLAIKAGQVEEDDVPSGELHSEDLW